MSDRQEGTGIYSCKWDFTREELRELGLRLALTAQEIYNAKAARKAVAAEFKATIEKGEAEAAQLVEKLNQRYEMREMDCRILYHHPREGQKTILRKDNGAEIRVEEMTAQERQSSFVFIDAPAETKKPKPQ